MSKQTASFKLYLTNLQDMHHNEIEMHIVYALAEATRKVAKSDLHDLGYFQNICDDAGEVVGSFAIKYEDGSVWRPER